MSDLHPSHPEYERPPAAMAHADQAVMNGVTLSCKAMLRLFDGIGTSHEMAMAKIKMREAMDWVGWHFARGGGEEGVGVPASLRTCSVPVVTGDVVAADPCEAK